MTKKRLNKDECWAKKWLKGQGYREILRPPSDPPDFVVDGRFAVEVTRMSQQIHIENANTSKGEEEARIPLTDCLERVLRNVGSPGNEGRSWVVNCTYDLTAPLPRPNAISAQVKESLGPLLNAYDEKVVFDVHSRNRDYRRHAGEGFCAGFPHICLACGICLDLWEFSDGPSRFILQDVSDGQGFHVASELYESIRNRIQVKSDSIRERQLIDKYASWWLLLVDYVYHAPVRGLSDHELSYLRNQNYDFWSRIIILSSKRLDWHYDLIADGTGQRTQSLQATIHDN